MTTPLPCRPGFRAATLVPFLLLAAASGAALRAQEPPIPQDASAADEGEQDRPLPPPLAGELQVDREARAVRLLASTQGQAFLNSLPPDHQYHALVHSSGGAAGRSLFVTDVSNLETARVLRTMGAKDGGGVPLAAWNLRWVPLVPQPATRVEGSRVQVSVTWDGAEREYALEELLRDPGGEGIEMRFGGNEEHHHEWESGCIMCLYSCPGGVISNAAYTIRDHQRGVTAFEPSDLLPPDGTEVIITLTVVGPD